MIIIKDSMVLINLSKIQLLEISCGYFGEVIIPDLVKKEILRKEYAEDTLEIQNLIEKKKIIVKSVSNKNLIKKANDFNIQRAEAEVIALYWELKADFIATDDNNVRKKKEILNLKIIGTPAILLKLFQENRINKEKIEKAIKKLKEIGWFANTIWDKIILEVNKNE